MFRICKVVFTIEGRRWSTYQCVCVCWRSLCFVFSWGVFVLCMFDRVAQIFIERRILHVQLKRLHGRTNNIQQQHGSKGSSGSSREEKTRSRSRSTVAVVVVCSGTSY